MNRRRPQSPQRGAGQPRRQAPARAEPARTPIPPRRSGPLARVQSYFLRHLQVLVWSLGQLSRRPLSTLMTAAVLGIALALPAGLQVLLKNVQEVTAGWDGATHVSLFLRREVDATAAQELAGNLRADAAVAEVRFISADQALEEFRQLSGFGGALDALEENPMPHVLVVRPAASVAGPEAVEGLVARLRARETVDMAQLDMQWVKRLYALMEIGRRGVWVLASLLALAVLLVVGNTIRLAIQNRRDEIVVVKLVGATDAFIRRPFLYTGAWYGLMGGTIAWVLVEVALQLLRQPVHHLAGLYHSAFRLDGLGLATGSTLLALGTLLGLIGAGLAVGRHLREIEPT